jgi:hypothetical protein
MKCGGGSAERSWLDVTSNLSHPTLAHDHKNASCCLLPAANCSTLPSLIALLIPHGSLTLGKGMHPNSSPLFDRSVEHGSWQ